MPTKKSLGQHWLRDRDILATIANEAEVAAGDTVLEIGPGLGTLTSELLRRAQKVLAVEFDEDLARKLPGQFPGKNLEVVHADILNFDLSVLPAGYKVVANVPYYITSKIVQKLAESNNPPSRAVLLVQKEVAERIAAEPGAMSMLSVATQVFFTAETGVFVQRELFEPVPEVDSQTVTLTRRDQPLIAQEQQKEFFRTVRAGFSERRKKLRSSLAGGLHLEKGAVDTLLADANIDPEARAQELSIAQWQSIAKKLKK